MAMVGMGADFPTDIEVMSCLERGGTREQCGMPAYCMAAGLIGSWDPRSWYRGLLPQCAPYTPRELETMTAGQMTQACTVDGVVDENCVQAGIDAARASAEGAARSDPEGTCEYDAAIEWPWVSRVLGTTTVCKVKRGEYNTLFLLAAAGLVAVMFGGRR